MQRSAKELGIAMRLWLEDARKHGDPIPEPGLAREEIERFAPNLSMAKPARRAGMNQYTLASKIRRKSPFTKDEAKAILKALEPA